MELKWYEFTQNNSGGSFEDENVCHRMLIEDSSFYKTHIPQPLYGHIN